MIASILAAAGDRIITGACGRQRAVSQGIVGDCILKVGAPRAEMPKPVT